MPTISQILITNTIDFGRSVLNQVSSAINGMLAAGVTTFSGNVVINPANTRAVSLNVSTGIIYGNGAGLFGLDANSVTLGLLRNSQLENSSITIVSANGINGVGTVSLGSNLTLNVVVVDSITNTRTDLAASANSIRWVESIIRPLQLNANGVNTGIVAVAVGGTGLTSYSAGQILLGNTQSGKLQANVILAGAGIISDAESGGIRLSANVIAGVNADVTILNGGGVQISANSPPQGDLSTAGIIQLADTYLSTSLTTAVTSNTVNGIAKYIASHPGIPDARGRLIAIDVYKTPGVTYNWVKRPNTDYVMLTLIGAGGSGALNVAKMTSLNTDSYVTFGGWSGALLEARILGANVGNNMNITIGWGGNTALLDANVRRSTGVRGGNTSFANSTFGYYANGGNGGIIIAGLTIVDTFYYSSTDDASTVALANVGIPTAPNPRPETFRWMASSPPEDVYNASSSDYYRGSSGGGVPGYCNGGQYIEQPISLVGGQQIYGPDPSGGSFGSGFGGGGGAGGYAYYTGLLNIFAGGGSGANGLCIVYSYSSS
jgi:hypothetical protein